MKNRMIGNPYRRDYFAEFKKFPREKKLEALGCASWPKVAQKFFNVKQKGGLSDDVREMILRWAEQNGIETVLQMDSDTVYKVDIYMKLSVSEKREILKDVETWRGFLRSIGYQDRPCGRAPQCNENVMERVLRDAEENDITCKLPGLNCGRRRQNGSLDQLVSAFIENTADDIRKQTYDDATSWGSIKRFMGDASNVYQGKYLPPFSSMHTDLLLKDAKSLGAVVAFNAKEEFERTPVEQMRQLIMNSGSYRALNLKMKTSFTVHDNGDPEHTRALQKWISEHGCESTRRQVELWERKLTEMRYGMGALYVKKTPDHEIRQLLTDTDLTWWDVVLAVDVHSGVSSLQPRGSVVMTLSKNINIKEVLTKYADERGINIDHLEYDYKITKQMLETGMYPRPVTTSKQLIRALTDHGFYDREMGCAICGQGHIFNGKPLTLELDHKDGNHSNNKVDNLHLLCPNCHSQQPTSKGRNSTYSRPNDIKEDAGKWNRFQERYKKVSSTAYNKVHPENVVRILAAEFVLSVKSTKQLIDSIKFDTEAQAETAILAHKEKILRAEGKKPLKE